MNLTSKELTALSEQLSGEQVLVQKYTRMANEAPNDMLRTKFMEISAKHQAHYDALFNYLR